jgi:hypothetical protein
MKMRFWATLLPAVLLIFLILAGSGCKKKSGLSPGDPSHYTVGDITFTMRYAPAATFPTGVDDSGTATVEHDFWIGETEVTYELWYEVRIWAEKNGYKFSNRGREGVAGVNGREPSENKNQPAVMMNWYDAVVWCNALSEYLGYEQVYTHRGDVYRNAPNREAGDNLTLRKVNGFRLPTPDEWELAARYRGRDKSHGAIEFPRGRKQYWSPGNYASGAKGPYTDEAASGAAAWYKANSEINGKLTTQPVGQKPAGGNGLNLYDMSGNVFEWLYLPPGAVPALRGGCYYREADNLQVGHENPRGIPIVRNPHRNVGLRLVLSLETGEPEDLGSGENIGKDEDAGGVALFPEGSLVEVNWQGKWYNARVLDFKDGLYLISYSGYDSSWDEWVDSSRIRERTIKPVIAAVRRTTVAVDYGTAPADLALPAEVEVILKDGSTFSAGVNWDTTPYSGTEAGEYELFGELTNLPVTVTNPDNIRAGIYVRVRDADGSTSRLRAGGVTDIEGLLYYIEHDSGLHGYYFGTGPPIDLTHLVIQDDKKFIAMVVFNAGMLPVQWVFPELTIAITVPGKTAFDAREAIHTYVHNQETVNMTLDISLDVPVEKVLAGIPLAFGPELSGSVSALKERVDSMGWLAKTVQEAAALAGTPHETALASMLSMAGVGMRMADQLAAAEIGTTSAGITGLQTVSFAQTGGITLRGLARDVAEQLSKTFAILSYLERIGSGYYDGQDIAGPAVSMLLCKGATKIAHVCHNFYMPNTPGNVSKCVKLCKTNLSCFTDICHPRNFSVSDAFNLRRPWEAPGYE